MEFTRNAAAGRPLRFAHDAADPGVHRVAILSLALGIGANTAIFSLIDTLMLRSLPVKSPEQLVELLVKASEGHFNAFSWQGYEYLRDNNHLLDLGVGHRLQVTAFAIRRLVT
ncbi:MAG TPA: hypothetical protein VGZ73_00945 [Bryobacteraceae bacterium]|nr:hypothetical protein [Bryobacteraceae bacterium]